MEDRSLRAVRGWIGALISTSLAASSHTLASGHLPPLPILGLILVVAAAICTALAGTGNSARRITLAVLLSQGTYHLLFSLVGHAPVSAAIAGTGPHAGHSMQLPSDLLLPASGGTMDAAAAGWMPLAHAVAALLTIAVLSRGESAMLSLLFVLLLHRPAAVLFARLAVPSTPPCQPVDAGSWGPRDLLFTLGAVLRRGPPLRTAF